MIVIVLRLRAVEGHIDQARQAAQANAAASRELGRDASSSTSSN